MQAGALAHAEWIGRRWNAEVVGAHLLVRALDWLRRHTIVVSHSGPSEVIDVFQVAFSSKPSSRRIISERMGLHKDVPIDDLIGFSIIKIRYVSSPALFFWLSQTSITVLWIFALQPILENAIRRYAPSRKEAPLFHSILCWWRENHLLGAIIVLLCSATAVGWSSTTHVSPTPELNPINLSWRVSLLCIVAWYLRSIVWS